MTPNEPAPKELLIKQHADRTRTLIWPDPKPDTVLCSSAVLQKLNDEYNELIKSLAELVEILATLYHNPVVGT